MLNKYIIFVSILLLYGCGAANNGSISCGDLMSVYAEKPKELKFKSCSKGKDQTLLHAKYFASAEHSIEIEKFLVEKYGLLPRDKYYFSMPLNRIFIEPDNLKKIHPFYHLSIDIHAENFEELIEDKDKKLESFWVHVKILVI